MNEGTRRFGAYEFVRAIGVGGMAETYVALRRGPGEFEQQVCLKRILPAFERDEAFIKMFMEEARLAARLRHTNIVQVIDFGVTDGSHYLALELVDGLDLKDLLRGLRARAEVLSSGLVSLIAVELAAALDFAHTGGRAGSSVPIVHRDLSPSNVLVSYAGEIKLTDFGIAKALKSTTLNLTQTVKGKVPYMAPEYALEGRYDRRSDLFALGVLLYECLAGERPYRGASDLEIVKNISEGNHPPLAEKCPNAPASLVQAVERLIDPDPNRRFATANDLLDALTDVSPAPTARRALGQLALSVRPVNPAPADTTSADLPTAQLGSTTKPDVLPPNEVPAESLPDASTRTRAPNANEKATPSDAPTRVDEAQADALARASANTKLITPVRGPHSELAETRVHFDAPPSAVAARSDATSTSKPKRHAWMTAIGGVVILALGGFAMMKSGVFARPEERPHGSSHETAAPALPVALQAEPAPTPLPAMEPLAPPAPAVPETAHLAAAQEANDDTSPAESDARDESARPARGHLRVVIIPFGTVYVDGRAIDRSPVRMDVNAGTHRVSAGPGTAEETVRVRPHETSFVEIRTRTNPSP